MSKAIDLNQRVYFRAFNETDKRAGLIMYDEKLHPQWVPYLYGEPVSFSAINKAGIQRK
jgi:hypothetical protein